MAACVTALPRIATRSRAVRVLRWSFNRATEYLRCELGLDQDEQVYELTIDVPWAAHPTTERFRDVQTAFHRQAAVERLLLDEGWSLERFESTTTER